VELDGGTNLDRGAAGRIECGHNGGREYGQERRGGG
jgi:hypothetical protein